jgi:hypothetical protein
MSNYQYTPGPHMKEPESPTLIARKTKARNKRQDSDAMDDLFFL